MTMQSLAALKIGDTIAISMDNGEFEATSVHGVLSGIQEFESGSIGLTIRGLAQWIWLNEKMTVTKVKA